MIVLLVKDSMYNRKNIKMSLTKVTSLFLFSFIIGFSSCTKAQVQEPNLRQQVKVTTPIFTVIYSETKHFYITWYIFEHKEMLSIYYTRLIKYHGEITGRYYT